MRRRLRLTRMFDGVAPAAVLLLFVLCLFPVSVCIPSSPDSARDAGSDDAVLTKSMGFPPLWKPYGMVGAVWDRGAESQTQVGADIGFGLYKDLGHPVNGIFGLALEGYGRGIAGEVDGGLRALVGSRSLLLHVGADYAFGTGKVKPVATLTFPLWRGGLFGGGSDFRFSWVPGSDPAFSLGLSIPLWQPEMGRTRPRRDYVALPSSPELAMPDYEPSQDLEETIADLREAGSWISRFATPFLDQEIRSDEDNLAQINEDIAEFKAYLHSRDEDFPGGHTYEGVIAFYHREIDEAFSLVLDGVEGDAREMGARAAQVAREALLEEVIIPYNRLLGQRKKNDELLGLGSRAEQIFRVWLYLESGIPKEKRAGVMYVFRHLVEFMEDSRERSRETWGESRLVWIPMHFALRKEDCDTQEEMDAIIERTLGLSFSTGNDVHYVINEQFQIELARMILKAEDYHVLWIHDYAGLNGEGDPDRIGYRMTREAYLRALTERVKRYDATGRMPVYLIFIDQYYYEVTKGKLWLEFLEDPLEREIQLPDEFAGWEQEIRDSQDELRRAVANSRGLQEGLKRYGRDWLRDRVKVHINITNPADFSFRSAHLADYMWIATDNIMRDHRKISFYDITELDPGKGEAIYTGTGVGEHYVGPGWDDRAVLARGPAVVDLKRTARELLKTQGFKDEDIPEVIKPRAKPAGYEDLVERLVAMGWNTSAMQVHNLTGFASKDANVARAVLYDLMPGGSHMYIPDSLWNNPLWGAMLVGAAMRGCSVFPIAPSLENAPSAGLPQMLRANELFRRFIAIQQGMREEIEAAGGMFRVGIYNLDINVNDQLARGELMEKNLAENPWLRDLFPFHPSVFEMLGDLKEELEAAGYEPVHLAGEAEGEHKPKLHMKSQFFASREALSSLLPLEEWAGIVHDYVLARADEIRLRGPDGAYPDVKDRRKKLSESAIPLFEAWDATRTYDQRERSVFYLAVGSFNQNYRSMLMDGEVLFLVSDYNALMAFMDFVGMIYLVTWVESVEELEEVLPSTEGIKRWISRYIKRAV
jgi:hypothetical protein